MKAIIVSSDFSQARILEETKLQASNQSGEFWPQDATGASSYTVKLTEGDQKRIEEAKRDWNILVCC